MARTRTRQRSRSSLKTRFSDAVRVDRPFRSISSYRPRELTYSFASSSPAELWPIGPEQGTTTAGDFAPPSRRARIIPASKPRTKLQAKAIKLLNTRPVVCTATLARKERREVLHAFQIAGKRVSHGTGRKLTGTCYARS